MAWRSQESSQEEAVLKLGAEGAMTSGSFGGSIDSKPKRLNLAWYRGLGGGVLGQATASLVHKGLGTLLPGVLGMR